MFSSHISVTLLGSLSFFLFTAYVPFLADGRFSYPSSLVLLETTCINFVRFRFTAAVYSSFSLHFSCFYVSFSFFLFLLFFPFFFFSSYLCSPFSFLFISFCFLSINTFRTHREL